MAEVTIRDYRATDRDAVRRICYETGMQGASIAPQYRDFDSFADIFTAWFTDHEPHNVLVAEQDGRVVGYAMSALDTRKSRGPLFYMIKHAILRLVPLRPGCTRFYWRCVMDSLSDLGKVKPHAVDHDKYPSSTHVNLLPSARTGGVATEMYYHLFDRVRPQGSRGMYGETLASNEGVAALARKLGFHKEGEPYLIPGLRSPHGERLKLQVVARSLEEWEPGAWKKSGADTAPGPRSATRA